MRAPASVGAILAVMASGCLTEPAPPASEASSFLFLSGTIPLDAAWSPDFAAAALADAGYELAWAAPDGLLTVPRNEHTVNAVRDAEGGGWTLLVQFRFQEGGSCGAEERRVASSTPPGTPTDVLDSVIALVAPTSAAHARAAWTLEALTPDGRPAQLPTGCFRTTSGHLVECGGARACRPQ